jgi:hypothetical protein
MLETSESCPHCGGNLKADVAGVLGQGLLTMAREAGNPIKIVINSARDTQLAFSGKRKAVRGWFKCVSCRKTSAVCPGCERAFILNQKRHNSTLDCPRCSTGLYVS